MSDLEFIGYVTPSNVSETIARTPPFIDPAFIDAAAQIHQAGGFDRVLLAFNSNAPDPLVVGQRVAAVTETLKLMIAHRTGFTAPSVAARQFATLDHLTRGRVAVHFITGGADAELARDGDHLSKDERYARTSEYIDIVRALWSPDSGELDYDGRFYSLAKATSLVKPYQGSGIPIYFGGASDAAIAVAGRHADVYALWGETLAQVADLTGRVRAAAAAHGRAPRFSLSLRPILADTEAAAWDRAEQLLARAKALVKPGPATAASEGAKRLLEAAAKGTRVDKRLWTAMAALTGANANTTALVGTPRQVAEALLDYHALGITTFLIRGFDPLADALAYGRDLIPLVRALAAERAGKTAA